jgi:hypothetical protein
MASLNLGDAAAKSIFNERIKQAFTTAYDQLGKALKEGNEKMAQAALSGFTTAAEKALATGADSAKQVAVQKLKDLKESIRQQNLAQAASDAIFNQQSKTAIANAKQRLADAISSGNQRIADAQAALRQLMLDHATRLADIASAGAQRLQTAQQALQQLLLKYTGPRGEIAARLKTDNETIAKIAQSAVTNLTTIGGKVATAIGKLFDAMHPKGVTGPPSKALVDAAAALKQLVAAGASPAEVQQAAARVRALSAPANTITTQATSALAKQKAAIQQHITGLFDAASKGHLNWKQLHTRILSYLHSQGLTYHNAGQKLGVAFADGLKKTVTAGVEQIKNLDELPRAQREAAFRRGGGGGGVKVIDVVAEIKKLRDREHQDQQTYQGHLRASIGRVEAAVKAQTKATQREDDRYTTRLAAAINRVTRAEQAKTAAAAKAQHTVTVTLQREQLSETRHHLAESRRQSTNLRKIQKATEATAKATAAVDAALGGHGSHPGFSSSTKKNPGHSAHAARQGASSGAGR